MKGLLEERSNVEQLSESELLVAFHRDHTNEPKRSSLNLDIRGTANGPALALLNEMSRKSRYIRPQSKKKSNNLLKRLEKASSTDFCATGWRKTEYLTFCTFGGIQKKLMCLNGRIPVTISQAEEIREIMFWARKTSGEDINAVRNCQANQQVSNKPIDINGKKKSTKIMKKRPNRSNLEIPRPAWNYCYKSEQQPKPVYLPRTPLDGRRNAVSNISKLSVVNEKKSNLRPNVSKFRALRNENYRVKKSKEGKDPPCHFSRRIVVVTSSSSESFQYAKSDSSLDILRPAEGKCDLSSEFDRDSTNFPIICNKNNMSTTSTAKRPNKSEGLQRPDEPDFLRDSTRKVRVRHKTIIPPKPKIPERLSWAPSTRLYKIAGSNDLGNTDPDFLKQKAQKQFDGNILATDISYSGNTHENREPFPDLSRSRESDSSMEIIWQAWEPEEIGNPQVGPPEPEKVATFDPIEGRMTPKSSNSMITFQSGIVWVNKAKNKLGIPSPQSQKIDPTGIQANRVEIKRHPTTVYIWERVRKVFKLTRWNDGRETEVEAVPAPTVPKKEYSKRFFFSKKSNKNSK